MADVLLGIDVGTSVAKAALFDLRLQRLAAASRRLPHLAGPPELSEVDMEVVWQCVADAVRDLPDCGAIVGIGVSANMVGAWLIDPAGRPVRPGILWNDTRTQALIDGELDRDPVWLDTIFAHSGSVMQQGCTLPLLRWLADNEPAAITRTHAVFGCKDWIRFRLTGEIATDPTEASVAPGDVTTRGRSQNMLEWLGVADHAPKLPVVRPSESVAGQLIDEAARQLGLGAGIPVAIGAGDVPSSILGAGAAVTGSAVAILGTTCLNGIVTDEPKIEPDNLGLTFCVPGALWARVMVNVAGTNALDWVARTLSLATDDGGADIARVEPLADRSPQGARGLTFLPYLSPAGVIAPFVEPRARGCFFGLDDRHEPGDLLRAVYEGTALAMRDCFSVMPAPFDEIRLVGGGARSEFWAQMIADCCERPVLTFAEEELGARGAALLAGVATERIGSIDAAMELGLQVGRRFEPTPHARATYDELAEKFVAYRTTMQHHWSPR